MNNEQLKQKLLLLRNDLPDFTLIMSGKKSKKVDGLYKPDTKEIIIHNKNHESDNELIYTAIHEFAHHIQFSENPLQKTARAHNARFQEIFHRLLFIAEEKNIFTSIFKSDREFIELTRNIKDNYLTKHGNLMIEFGGLLMQAMKLCEDKKVSFEDYLSRELLLNKSEAKNIIKVSKVPVNPSIGYENMLVLANLKDDKKRNEIEKVLLENKATPEMIKAEIKNTNPPKDELELLLNEKTRLEKTIKNLENNLADISERIKKIKHKEK